MSTSDNSIVIQSDSIELQDVKVGVDTQMQVLIGPPSAPNFAMRRFIMQPGGGMPKHTNEVEHEQFVLQGQAKIEIGDKVHQVKRGDILYIPKGVPHSYLAEGTEPFEFLCVVPNLPDKIKIVESNEC